MSKRPKGKMEMWCFLFSFFFPLFKLLLRAQRIHKEFTIRLFLECSENSKAARMCEMVMEESRAVSRCSGLWLFVGIQVINLHCYIKQTGQSSGHYSCLFRNVQNPINCKTFVSGMEA